MGLGIWAGIKLFCLVYNQLMLLIYLNLADSWARIEGVRGLHLQMWWPVFFHVSLSFFSLHIVSHNSAVCLSYFTSKYLVSSSKCRSCQPSYRQDSELAHDYLAIFIGHSKSHNQSRFKRRENRFYLLTYLWEKRN